VCLREYINTNLSCNVGFIPIYKILMYFEDTNGFLHVHEQLANCFILVVEVCNAYL